MADRTAPVVKLTRQFYRKRSTTTEMKLSKKIFDFIYIMNTGRQKIVIPSGIGLAVGQLS